MNKRRALVILFIFVLASGALAFERQVQRASGTFSSGSLTTRPKSLSPQTNLSVPQQYEQSQHNPQLPSEIAAIPKHVIYGLLFKEMAAFKKKAVEKEQQGQDSSALRNYHKQQAKLNDKQARDLDRIAADCAREVAKLDEKAKKIIDTDRARRADIKFKAMEPLPAPPAELKDLEEQRKTVILNARESLHASLGDAEFQRFDEFVQQDIASKIKRVQRAVPPTALR